MSDQERWIASTFVEIADHLVDEFDVVDLLSTLAERCAEFVSASEVGFVLIDPTGVLQVIGSSSEKMESLELMELQNSEGPCWDSFNTGKPVLNQNVHGSFDKWPTFGPVVDAAGMRTVHALPMRLRSDTIGAINIFHSDLRELSEHEVVITQALADAATIAIMQDRNLRHATQLAEQLQYALEARVVIEQAKGVLAERLQVDMHDAFSMLRQYSREHNRRLSTVAQDVTEGKLPSTLFEKASHVKDGPTR